MNTNLTKADYEAPTLIRRERLNTIVAGSTSAPIEPG